MGGNVELVRSIYFDRRNALADLGLDG